MLPLSPRSGVLALAVALGSVVACSSSGGASSSSGSGGVDPGTASTQPPVTTLFSRTIESVTIEIDYAVGAEPFQGALKNFGDPWNLVRTNTLAIFDGKKKLTLPTTLAKMEKLADVPAKDFTSAELVELAAAHRNEPQYENAVAFYVVFVNGLWIDDTGTQRPDILGVAVPNTGIVGMFKPAIPSALTEQLALIHQLAHAIGFVDNGIPVGDANRAHVDTENVHHCTNKQCALSFAVETKAGASAYASTYIRGPEAVLIGQECLSDARILESSQ